MEMNLTKFQAIIKAISKIRIKSKRAQITMQLTNISKPRFECKSFVSNLDNRVSCNLKVYLLIQKSCLQPKDLV